MPVDPIDPTPILLASYWGKADPRVALQGHEHHTVLGHSLDVAACAFVLIEQHQTLQRQLGSCTEIVPAAVAVTFAGVIALHDIGKLDTRFQRKAPHIADILRPETSGIAQGKYDHGVEGFRQIEDDETARNHLQSLLGPNALPLLCAVCGHHGVFPSREEPDPSRSSLRPEVRRQDAVARRLFQDCVVEFFRSLGAALPWSSAVDGAVMQRLGGLCAVADWLGSNVDDFPYEPGPLSDPGPYWYRACERARSACSRAGLLRVTPAPVDFHGLFPAYSPRDVQILTEQVVVERPALIIVEAEMGKGKTEAALSMAARFLALGLGDGLTVALPTMATSNAMFARIEEVAPRLFPVGDVQLALAHGRARRQPRFQALARRGLRAHDLDAPEASVMCARWLIQRKRILLAQIGVGTIDQALQAALIVPHQFVRMFELSRNVVIIDEVHAYDAYMEVLLEHLLSWLGALGVPVILLSATLPSERRAALARAWRGADHPAGAPGQDRGAADSVETACAEAYPLVSITTSGGTATRSGGGPATSRLLPLDYRPRTADVAAHPDRVAAQLVAAAQAGGRVVWIRNTVREAQEAFRAVSALADGVEHRLFHARFRGCDRNQVEQAVLDRFGKNAPSGGRVLIATQVVEQSLDLDFDEMHTDLAPIDLIFQRAGRLHRHVRARLSEFEHPLLVVHGPSDVDLAAIRFGPSRFVYDLGTLWIAAQTLRGRNCLVLPDDIRRLVEESYHPAARAAFLERGGSILVAAEAKRAGELEARRTKAKQCCIAPTTAEPGGGVALPDDDDAVYAFTRDGVSATLLPFSWDGENGRVLDAEHSLPGWPLDADRDDAWRLADELLDHTLSLPARHDLEGEVASDEAAAWASWRRRFERFADESGLGKRVVPLPMKRDGDAHTGWLGMNGRRRRVLYSPILGLVMPSAKDEALDR